jgi:hypothetical protein
VTYSTRWPCLSLRFESRFQIIVPEPHRMLRIHCPSYSDLAGHSSFRAKYLIGGSMVGWLGRAMMRLDLVAVRLVRDDGGEANC